MAIVYVALQRDLDRHVALKELSRFHAGSEEFAQRFYRESQLAGQLNHHNIVTVHEYFKHEQTQYIAMEYLPRGSLRPYMKRLTLGQTCGVLEGVLAGLTHAESAGIVHRDLKPENVMVTPDGSVKITDFGIARATVSTGFRTETGMTVGTPAYMAPEQASGSVVGPWTDLYSVGIMAYELVVGNVPFHDTNAPMALMMRHLSEPIPAAAQVRPEVDPALSEWIESLLVKDPKKRVGHALEAWEALEDIIVQLRGPMWRRNARLLDDKVAAREAAPLTPAPFESGGHIATPTPEPIVSVEQAAAGSAPIEVNPLEPAGDVAEGGPLPAEDEPGAADSMTPSPPTVGGFVTFSPDVAAGIPPAIELEPVVSPDHREAVTPPPVEPVVTPPQPESVVTPAPAESVVTPPPAEVISPPPEPAVSQPPEPAGVTSPPAEEAAEVISPPLAAAVTRPPDVAVTPPPEEAAEAISPSPEQVAVASADTELSEVAGAVLADELPSSPSVVDRGYETVAGEDKLAPESAPDVPASVPDEVQPAEAAPDGPPVAEPALTAEPMRVAEPMPIAEPISDPAPAAPPTPVREEAPAGVSRPRGRVIAAAAAAVAAAAALGFIFAPHSSSNNNGPAPLRQSAIAGPLTVHYPVGWRRATHLPPEARSLGLSSAVNLTPAGSTSGGALVLGTAKSVNTSLVSPAFASSLSSPLQGKAVKLKPNGYVFSRYLYLEPKGAPSAVSLYVLPTSAGTATAACIAPASGAAAFTITCERVVGSLRVKGTVLPLGPSAKFASRLSSATRKLDSARTKFDAKLAGAKTPAAQASAAHSLAGAYNSAADAAATAKPNPPATLADAALVRGLRRLGRDYAALSVAAAHHSSASYGTAKRAIGKDEARVAAAFKSVKQAGYTLH